MLNLLVVGAGGFLGATLRYGISVLMLRVSSTFPWATLAINVAGCFAIGLAVPRLQDKPLWALFLVPGLLGGFTTFSAFGHETCTLAKGGAVGLAVAYAAASVLLGVGAVAFAWKLR